MTYVNDPAKRPNRICPVQNITANRGILHDNTGGHDRILCRLRQVLENQIHHLSQRGILILEELRNAKEQRRRLVRRELLPGEDEDSNLGQESATYARGDGGGIEHSCWTTR